MKKLLLTLFLGFILSTSCFAETHMQLLDAGDYEGMLPIGVSSEGLVAYYKLDNSAKDSSGNGHDGTLVNTTTGVDQYGRADHAVTFDGSTSYITLPNSDVLLPDATAISIIITMKPNVSVAGDYLIGFQRANRSSFMSINGTTGQNYLTWIYCRDAGGGVGINGSIDVEDGEYHNIIYTRDGPDDTYGYVDNVQDFYAGDAGQVAGAFVANIGAIYNNAASYGYNGIADEMFIFSRVITAGERALFLARHKATYDEMNFDTTDLLGFWQLNGNGNDSSGQGNHATVVGPDATTDMFGVADRAMLWDPGTNDYMTIPSFVSSPSALTIGGWITREDNTGGSWFCAMHHATAATVGSSSFWMGFTSRDYLNATIGANSGAPGTYNAGTTTTLAAIGEWNRIYAVWDGSKVIVYLNGQYNKVYALANYNTLATPVRFGSANDGIQYRFSGKGDNFKIFERELSATEILDSYNHEKGKFGIHDDNKVTSIEFIEDTGIAVEGRKHEGNLTIKGEFNEI